MGEGMVYWEEGRCFLFFLLLEKFLKAAVDALGKEDDQKDEGQAGRRLVEKNQLRPGHQTAGDG